MQLAFSTPPAVLGTRPRGAVALSPLSPLPRLRARTQGRNGGARMSDASQPRPERPSAKQLAKLYGGSYIGTSFVLSLGSYFALYALIVAGVDVSAVVHALGDLLARTPLGRPAVLDGISDTASAATLAYIAHKATSPLRFPLTVAATPVVARAFAKKDDDVTGGEP